MKYLILVISLIAVSQAVPAVDVQEGSAVNATRIIDGVIGWGGYGGIRGGTGGSVWTVWDPWAFRDAINSNEPRIINIRGQLNLDYLFERSPGVLLQVGSYTTITGGDRDAEIMRGGLLVGFVEQVIIQNLRINNAISYDIGEQPDGNGGIVNLLEDRDYSEIDGIEVEGARNVWIDHCEFSDDPWVHPIVPRRHDGLIDIVHGSDRVTISNNIFRNHDHTTLVGNDDMLVDVDGGRLRVTFFANWYMGVRQRCPRVRFGKVHVLNNLYTDIGSYAVGVGVDSSVVVERNVFRNTNRAWGWTGGEESGRLENRDNQLHSSGFDSGIPSNVDWDPSGTYDYRAIAIDEVENYVRNNAGVWR